MRAPAKIDVQLDLKLLKLSGSWEPNDVERKAAWELYVDLVTRVAAVTLVAGSLREALSSIYSIFPITRGILRTYGPRLAESKPDGTYSFGYLAVARLNFTIRPRLAYWHPVLQAYEETRQAGQTTIQHENSWQENAAMRADLTQMSYELRYFCGILAGACGVPSLAHALPNP